MRRGARRAGAAVVAAAREAGAEPAPADPAHPASLVIQTSFLGDMVLTTPLIAELAARGPVDVVTTPAAAPLLANNPSVRDVLVYDKHGTQRGASGLWRMARALRTRHAADHEGQPRGTTVAYMAQGSLRSAMLATAAGIGERVGFDTSAGRALYTRRVRYLHGAHHTERLWRLAAGPGAHPAPEALQPRLYPGATERAAVDEVLHEAGYDGEPLIALAPGSVWATKRWPSYPELAVRLARRGRIVIVGGQGDVALADAIVAALPDGEAINAAGRLPLLASAELVRRARVLVTNDSAPQHLASAVGTPTLTIFVSTVPALGFGPLAPGSMVAELGESADAAPGARDDAGGQSPAPGLSAARIEQLVLDLITNTEA